MRESPLHPPNWGALVEGCNRRSMNLNSDFGPAPRGRTAAIPLSDFPTWSRRLWLSWAPGNKPWQPRALGERCESRTLRDFAPAGSVEKIRSTGWVIDGGVLLAAAVRACRPKFRRNPSSLRRGAKRDGGRGTPEGCVAAPSRATHYVCAWGSPFESAISPLLRSPQASIGKREEWRAGGYAHRPPRGRNLTRTVRARGPEVLPRAACRPEVVPTTADEMMLAIAAPRSTFLVRTPLRETTASP